MSDLHVIEGTWVVVELKSGVTFYGRVTHEMRNDEFRISSLGRSHAFHRRTVRSVTVEPPMEEDS